MRFERKYRIDDKSVAAVKQLMRFHPASFRELYPDRQVNNIYFDTPTLSTFHQNVNGNNERKKFRVRWYGEDVRAIESPTFEIKIKHNELGSKETMPVLPFSLDHLQPITQQVNRISSQSLALQPVLLNSYYRSYLISNDGKYRLTLDHQMTYHSLLNAPRFRKYYIHDDAVILEVKYEEADDNQVNFITQNMPFRQGKHSKYVNGVQMTY